MGESAPYRLTQMQKRWVDNIMQGMTKAGAALAAGYAHSGDYRSFQDNKAVKDYHKECIETERERTRITREDVINGMKTAIDDAQVLGDPSSQIKGWTEIGKILGYYAPEKKELQLGADAQALLASLEGLSTEQLLQMAGPDVIEGDFFVHTSEFEIMEDDNDKALPDLSDR